jgi:hypothetical protein
LDDSGQIYLWQRKEGSFRIVMSDKFETGELSPELIALLNPVEHKLAISSGRTLYIAQINPAPQETENTANLDTSANATEKLIVKAALQQYRTRPDFCVSGRQAYCQNYPSACPRNFDSSAGNLQQLTGASQGRI